ALTFANETDGLPLHLALHQLEAMGTGLVERLSQRLQVEVVQNLEAGFANPVLLRMALTAKAYAPLVTRLKSDPTISASADVRALNSRLRSASGASVPPDPSAMRWRPARLLSLVRLAADPWRQHQPDTSGVRSVVSDKLAISGAPRCRRAPLMRFSR
ncbi:MAG TPA: hypothetical protein VF637_12870, partial [Sphingomicrobium sp.]